MNNFIKKPGMGAGTMMTHSETAQPMSRAEISVRLIEEMMDLKLQQYAETQMRMTPELSRLLNDKRETDRRRLEQLRVELVRIFSGG